MKALKFLTIIVLAGCLSSCADRNVADDSTDMSDSSDLQRYMETVSLDSIFGAMHALSMTEEQFQILSKVLTVYWMNFEYKDGEFVFMTEEEFLAEGFPKSYYTTVMRDINEWKRVAPMESKDKVVEILCDIRNGRQLIEQGTIMNGLRQKLDEVKNSKDR